jgi:predicted nucleotide-binding protein
MPTNKGLLLSLREKFDQLELFDDSGLNALRDRGRMIIRRVFGADSSYSERFSDIEFHYTGPFIFIPGEPETPAQRQGREDIWRSGQRESIALIDTMIEDLELDMQEQVRGGGDSTVPKSNRVFVVHGHDEGMRESVARVLIKLGLEPVILHEQPDRGRTIIEKFYDYSDVGFAVVLLSPDDTGYSNADGPDTARPRARQNVILELGFFLGKLGRGNVVALHRGHVEIPSDFSGVLFTPYVSGGDWPYKLTRELRVSGYQVSADDL